MPTDDLADVIAIQQLIARFANSFDTKDWEALGECLADRLHTDYSDLRGSPPETLVRESFVDLRRSALNALRTHHLAGNVEVVINGHLAEARVSMTIHRCTAGGEIFNTHCLYTLGLDRDAGRWMINSIVQTVLMNEGERRIHNGVQQ